MGRKQAGNLWYDYKQQARCNMIVILQTQEAKEPYQLLDATIPKCYRNFKNTISEQGLFSLLREKGWL